MNILETRSTTRDYIYANVCKVQEKKSHDLHLPICRPGWTWLKKCSGPVYVSYVQNLLMFASVCFNSVNRVFELIIRMCSSHVTKQLDVITSPNHMTKHFNIITSIGHVTKLLNILTRPIHVT